MSTIQSLSQKLTHLFQVLFYIAPVITVGMWLQGDTALLQCLTLSKIPLENITLNEHSRLIGMIISLNGTVIIMYGFHQLKNLFRHYQQGNIFSVENVRIYKALGGTLFVLFLFSLIETPLLSLALSYQNAVGERFISVAVFSSDLILLISGFVIWVIADVMKEAQKLNVEVEHTV